MEALGKSWEDTVAEDLAEGKGIKSFENREEFLEKAILEAVRVINASEKIKEPDKYLFRMRKLAKQLEISAGD